MRDLYLNSPVLSPESRPRPYPGRRESRKECRRASRDAIGKLVLLGTGCTVMNDDFEMCADKCSRDAKCNVKYRIHTLTMSPFA